MPKKKIKKTSSKNNKAVLWLALAVIILLLITGAVIKKQTSDEEDKMVPPIQVTTQPTTFDFGNQTLQLNNQQLTFINGQYMSSDNVSGQHSAQIIHRSISPSGKRAAAILVDSPGGSGMFYYVVGAIRQKDKEVYSTPVLLGDRIKVISVTVDDPQEHDNGEVTIKSLQRASDAPMAAEPTKEVTTKYAFENNGNLISVLH
jgi:hypothetical protein